MIECADIHLINYMLVKLAAFNFDGIFDLRHCIRWCMWWFAHTYVKAHKRRGHDHRLCARVRFEAPVAIVNIGLFVVQWMYNSPFHCFETQLIKVKCQLIMKLSNLKVAVVVVDVGIWNWRKKLSLFNIFPLFQWLKFTHVRNLI